jgi:D-glycero-alpha-D-manno-heptose-7-phosphate kinase
MSDGMHRRPVCGHIHHIVEDSGMLLYTEKTRKANDILPNWRNESIQRDIQSLAEEVEGCLNDSIGRVQLGEYLQQTMALKRCVPGVMDEELLSQYDYAMDCGALGGKLLGAGAGGCWFFLVPTDGVRRAIREGLGLREIPFRIAMDGCQERML